MMTNIVAFTERRDAERNRFALTDAGNAEMFASLHGEQLRFDHRRRRWLIWGGHRWQADTDGYVRRLAKETIRDRQFEALEIEDSAKRKDAVKHALASESRQRLDAMLSI